MLLFFEISEKSQMRKADVSEIKESIKMGGLSEVKSKYIHTMLQDVYKKYGETSLEFLRDRNDDEIKKVVLHRCRSSNDSSFQELLTYKGLGLKTISCVLMFSLDRDDLPVDTHAHRVATRY